MGNVSSGGLVKLQVLRIAVAVGGCIDIGVAIVSLFFQSLLEPLFDLPLRDPALTTIAGGEYVVAALIYATILRGLERYRALLWLIALDQLFAAALPALEIIRGAVVASWKTIGPIPLSTLLCAIYTWGALGSPFTRGSASTPAPARGGR
jgi:hypothetical protein